MTKKILTVAMTTLAMLAMTPAIANAETPAYYDPSYMKIVGDINDDGKIDATDATEALLEYTALSVGKTYFNDDNDKWLRADINIDNKVDATDATEILEIYAYNSTATEPLVPTYGFYLTHTIVDAYEEWKPHGTFEDAEKEYDLLPHGVSPIKRNYLYQVWAVRFVPEENGSWGDMRTLLDDQRQ